MVNCSNSTMANDVPFLNKILQLSLSLACTLGIVLGKPETSINIHQMQFVADHLSDFDCTKLKTALHQTSFTLNETAMAELENVKKSNKPCIYYLLVWERINTSEMPFNDFTMRLKQIGREDLANRLADSVFDEEIEVLDKNFLDNPFKKHVPKHSVLLATDNDEEERPKSVPDDSDRRFTGWEIFSIVVTSITLVFAGILLVYKLFGDLLQRLFLQYAPEFLVTWTSMVWREGVWCCRQTGRRFEKTVLGKRSGGRGRGEKPDRAQLLEMNRNLNNYLYGHLTHAAPYLQQLHRN